MPQVVITVVCALIERDGLFLATRRPPEKSQGNLWEFPGGKIEPGESAREALVREIREELATAVIVDDPLPAVIHHYETLSIKLIPFRCRLRDPECEPDLREHSELLWIRADDMEHLEWAPADQPIVDALQPPGENERS